MAKLVFTTEDERLIDSLVKEFEPTAHPISAPLADLLPSDAWARFCEAARSYVGKKAKACMAARAIIEAMSEAGVLDADGMRTLHHHEIWDVNLGMGGELPDEFTDRSHDLPLGPSGEWSLPADYIITVGEIIEEHFRFGLFPQAIS